jgi:glycosyltransferase 2 family protein
MFMLTPVIAGTDFVGVLVPFVLSTLLAFASHAPGGLGVFDASMLVGLPQFAPEQLLAALLLFRLLYYIIPFILAVSIMGTRELFMSANARAALRQSEETAMKKPPKSMAPCQSSSSD